MGCVYALLLIGPENRWQAERWGCPVLPRTWRTFLRGCTMRGLIRLFSLFLLIRALLGVPAANGQGGATGAISGTVTDVSGGSVADAEVQISNSATDLL